MLQYLKTRSKDFSSDILQYGSCLMNIILCLCMAYFYYDSEYHAPMLYSAFFLLYILTVFISGRKLIPIMYLLYCMGGLQNITFINLSGFFIMIGLSWCFPKWKIPLFSIYGLEIFFVCYRHGKSVWHLLAHIAFCIVFYFAAEQVKLRIEKDAVEKARKELEDERCTKYNKIKAEFESNKLNLTEDERFILSEICAGKQQKEIDRFSENTVSAKLKTAYTRNNCTKDELKIRFLKMVALEASLNKIVIDSQ